MAKLGLIFLVFFIIVQVSLAHRLRREVDVEDVKKTAADIYNNVKAGTENLFSEDNLKTVKAGVEDVLEKLKTYGQELASKVQEKPKEVPT